uniref:Uncharacterized protein n=1 Tax=Quercus lobata TaxID=97700 RepID=A0A7N2KSA0_QUELO
MGSSPPSFDICKELSIPTYIFFTPSTSFLAYCLYLPTLESEVVGGEFVDLSGPVQVLGCTPVRPEDLLDQVRHQQIDEYKWGLFYISRLPMAAGHMSIVGLVKDGDVFVFPRLCSTFALIFLGLNMLLFSQCLGW